MLKVLSDYYQATAKFSRNAKLFLGSLFLGALGFSAFGVIFNLCLAEAKFPEGFIGNILSVSALAGAIFALPAGLTSDRIGRKRALLFSLLLLCISVLIKATTLNKDFLLAVAAFSGLAGALAGVTDYPFLMENSTPEERTHLFSVCGSTGLIAMVIGSALGGRLPEVFHHLLPDATRLQSYRLTLVTSSLFSFSALIPLVFLHEVPRSARAAKAKVSWGDKHDLITIGKFSLISLFMGAGAGLVIPFFNLYFSKRFGATSAQIGLYFSGFSIITAADTLLVPIAAKRLGKLKTIVFAYMLSLPFLVLLGSLERYLTFAVLAFWIRGCLANMSGPLSGAMRMEMIPEKKRATAESISDICWNLPWAGATAFSGRLMQSQGITLGRVSLPGYSAPYYLTALLYFISATCFYFFFKGYEEGDRESAKTHHFIRAALQRFRAHLRHHPPGGHGEHVRTTYHGHDHGGDPRE